ncbi:hypothetical protein ISS37_04090 [candidate division KSB1 bacterium]|nr:hypothetical protein [candidate division KSB1 bacterium]
MNPEFWRNFFQWMMYIATAFILIGTIGVNIFTKKIEKLEKDKTALLERQRDAEIEKNIKNTEKLLTLNTFLGGIDNPVEKLFLIIDFYRSCTVEELQGFVCYLNFHKINRTYEFKVSHAMKHPENEMRLFLKQKSVNSGEWNSNPSIMQAFHNRAETSFLAFDLWYFLKEKPKGLKIRDLNSAFFEIAVSKKHSNLIKEFQINVNDWTIIHRNCIDNNWKDYKSDWLPSDKIELGAYYYRDFQNREIITQRIDFFQEGASRYYVMF